MPAGNSKERRLREKRDRPTKPIRGRVGRVYRPPEQMRQSPSLLFSVDSERMKVGLVVAANMNFKIRAATKEDCKDIERMIMELAVFENMADHVKISHKDKWHGKLPEVKLPYKVNRELERDGFSQNPLFECLVAEVPEEHKSKEGCTVVGFAFYLYTYSTWKGRVIGLEDLYVMQEFRGNGIGKGLLSKVAELAIRGQCVWLDTVVMDWNTPAREFYAAKGAEDLTQSAGRHCIRFHGQDLDNLANEASKD